jgi:hypothetical protein
MEKEMRRMSVRLALVTCCVAALAAAGCSKSPQDSASPAAVAKPQPPPRTFTLAAGSVLVVQTTYTLTTDKQVAGEKFVATLAEPIVDGDWVVAKQGAEVEGLVVASSKGGRVKGTAHIEIAVTGLTLADGQRVAVTTAVDAVSAASTKGKDARRIAVAAGIGTAIGAIAGGGKGAAIGAAAGGGGGTALVLGTRGKPAEIPARSLLHFKVVSPVEIVEKK